MRRLGQTGGEFVVRMERQSLAKKEIQGQGKGLKMTAESGEDWKQEGKKKKKKRENEESWHCWKRTHLRVRTKPSRA